MEVTRLRLTFSTTPPQGDGGEHTIVDRVKGLDQGHEEGGEDIP